MKKLISNHSKRFISCLVIVSILLTTVFSVISVKDFFVSAEETEQQIKYWDGTVATEFAGGTGTSADPFLIENGAQLAKAVIDKGLINGNGAAAYYIITNDIYLNEDYANYKNWGSNAPQNNWGITYTSSAFAGNLNGDYYTVYGMYYSKGGSYAGLVAYLSGTNAKICNLTIANAYVNNTGGNTTALFAGRFDAGTITNCIARDSYLTNKDNKTMAGIAAWSNTNTTKITNCAAYGLTFSSTNIIGGILAQSNSGNATVSKCFSGGTFIFGNTSNIACSDSYTDVDAAWKNGVKEILDGSMKGATALTAMANLDKSVWKTTESYPDFIIGSGKKGEVWSGAKDRKFAGGKGTQDDPFLIETGEQLAKAISDKGLNNGAAAYYLLTNDIYLNEDYTNYKNWGSNAPKNNWGITYSSSAFAGVLDGGYHTIYGMYYKKGGSYAGLVAYLSGTNAKICNLTIANAYVNNTGGNTTALFAGRFDTGTIESCIARDSYLTNNDNKTMAGIAAWSNNSSTKIISCGAYGLTFSSSTIVGGILAQSNNGNATVSKCFSGGTFIFGNTNNIACSNSYTDVDGAWKNGVTEKLDGSMKGAGALTAMANLDTSVWKVTESYPVLRKINDGKKGEVWDGAIATKFADGDGSESDPYIIETAPQLYKAITDLGKKGDGTAAYYLITADIYLNEDYENYAEWGTTAPQNNWNPTRGDFIGHLDGGFHTIYGLYSRTGAWQNGLIPIINSGATVSRVIVANAYIRNNDAAAAGIVGGMYDNTVVEKCMVYNAVISAKNSEAAGIVAKARTRTTTIKNCATYNVTLDSPAKVGGILAQADQVVDQNANVGTRVQYCYSVGNWPFGNNNNIWATACSTDAEGEKYNVYKLDVEKMMGTLAVSNMSLPGAVWQENESYPVFRITNNGEKDAVWDGAIASNFAGGTGTEADPFLIETAPQLYKAIVELGKNADGTAAYYTITEDIYLNEDYENYASWGETAPKNNWLPINSTIDFIGHINGGGHTVYGLYTNKNSWCVGLIARVRGGSVRDLNVAKSYIQSGDGTVGGIIGMAYEKTIVSRCKAYDTVIVDKAAKDLGGIVGAAERTVMITGCATYNINAISTGCIGGILGRAWSNANIRDSYSIGLYPLGVGVDTYRVNCVNVYTDTKEANKSGVTVLKTDDMKGAKALEKMSMPASLWKADSVSYPVFADYYEGVEGEIWTGAIAENYAGGDGTEQNPYLIATGEQLYKMVYENCIPGNVSKYYKVVADIRLNNTDGDKWYEKANLNKWHISKIYSFSFAGQLDGDGHTVSGIYTESEEGNAYAGLIPVLEMGSSVKNIGVIESNINTASTVAENFSGGIVGWIDDWDSGKPELVTEENIPVVSGCFADSTVILGGMYCGGIVSGVAAPVLIENCYFTGKFANYSSAACIIGNVWTQGSKISHCFAATDRMYTFAGGQSVLKNDLKYEACYNFGKGSGTNFYFVSLYDIRGEKAKKTLSELDFENIWKTVDGGTPVLRVFGDDTDKFSYKDDVYSTVNFITNVTGMSIEPMRGIIDSPIDLPEPKRDGYNFAGWYVYVELQCEYTYDTFPFIDLTLYAKWDPIGIEQDFENYPNTDYDLAEDYVYFRPGVENYDGGNIHSGNKAIKRLGNSSERQDFLVKYEEELTVGKEYTISFWMMTETKGATGKVSMLHATWPDIAEPVKGDEITIAKYKNLSVGEWKQYTFKFTAKTPWVSFRTDGDTVLYFDDILIY